MQEKENKNHLSPLFLLNWKIHSIFFPPFSWNFFSFIFFLFIYHINKIQWSQFFFSILFAHRSLFFIIFFWVLFFKSFAFTVFFFENWSRIQQRRAIQQKNAMHFNPGLLKIYMRKWRFSWISQKMYYNCCCLFCCYCCCYVFFFFLLMSLRLENILLATSKNEKSFYWSQNENET